MYSVKDIGNPVRAGFVETAGDYYANRKGLIELSYVCGIGSRLPFTIQDLRQHD